MDEPVKMKKRVDQGKLLYYRNLLQSVCTRRQETDM
ncbi:unnamed protein product [Brassica oleracea]|uniref:(rape) hypothetical protein n=1 Tax=Brassica napus TaxID=3708 RepID=A0A816KM69_BRANA|nr:unnamed protein product [Brassica napus]